MGKLKFYRDEPLFGLDIGHGSLKAIQIDNTAGKQPTVLGYGSSDFEASAVQNGIIAKPDTLASAMHQLFEKNLVGNISSRRVACSLPTAHTFSRPMKVPVMTHSDIVEAVHLEAQQYIPVPLEALYIDYEIVRQDEKEIELLLVATSRKIVDSYLSTLQSLQLEPVAFEPSINATSRLLKMLGNDASEPSILVDIGSVDTDIALFDSTLIVSSTVNGGGDTITSLISKSLHLSLEQAAAIKNEYGISYSERQQRIIDAIRPQLDALVKEIQKSMRYYSERATKSGKHLSRVIMVGGGSVMPGLNQYLAKELRLPAINLEPWGSISFGNLAVPGEDDRPKYITAAGEAILNPKEISA